MKKTLLIASATTACLAPLTGVATAQAATTPLNVYQHGLYNQAHFSSMAECNTARSAALTAVKQYGGTLDKAGECHYLDALKADKTAMKGYLYDITYKRSKAIWNSDVNSNLGSEKNVTPLTGAHSFKFRGSYATQAEAKSVEANRASYYQNTKGFKLTWRSGVVQDPSSKKWVYEIDYNSRVPSYAGHTQISEKPNVTSPSLGIITIVTPNPGTVNGQNPVVTPPVTPPTTTEPSTTPGIDISGHTILNDWEGWKKAGYKWMYMKATEGNVYKSPSFSTQYTNSLKNGFIRGAYHFGIPSTTTGAEQADYFIANGGGWSPDGQTLPGTVDLEWNPYKSVAGGNMCYGLSQQQIADWTTSFVNEYKAKTGVKPMIYTANQWWSVCVGDKYKDTETPLWIASYSSSMGKIPSPWSKQAIWQYAALDSKGFDLDIYNGTLSSLKRYATTGIYKG